MINNFIYMVRLLTIFCNKSSNRISFVECFLKRTEWAAFGSRTKPIDSGTMELKKDFYSYIIKLGPQ